MTPKGIQFLLVLWLGFSSQFGISQGSGQQYFELGYQAYMRNQFPIAETHFRRAFTNASTPEDKGFILKFLGISQFMRGDRKSAAASFMQAVRLDPSLAVFQEEVLDPSVIKFFDAVKVQALKSVVRNTPPPKSSTPAPGAMTGADIIEESDSVDASPPVEQKVEKKKKKKKRKKRRRRKKRPPVEEESSFSMMHLLPFGTPQFYNGEYIFGSIYGLGQVATLGIFITRQSEIAKEEDENSRVEADESLSQEVKDAFIEENSNYISTLETDASTALIGFGLLYTTSVVHGILSAPDPTPPKRRRRTSLNRDNSDLQVTQMSLDSYRSSQVTQWTILPLKKGWAFHFQRKF
ncbi:tetratricopeptide repeat protein [Pseudobacteriovorax antillogorgiicola]|uniref:Tetratricopeptide repeat-containing protein n=1 Tax=Pseudobacteriovorax antillogorgiicola TaxID=1513793 RepID=A0A1Y6BZD6_9BACT|nr:hypothetical protein [Pseudobacteriovorax antillogorgiicola]TCS51278.1 hypothetical protein EDD56_111163 [Pseudobacteriovorax antillogorgiicola]SMF36247.1 hypothetical protein SAMN06296036_11115 [Pseudobacteriovorax antillogorgiicola]